LPHFKLPAGVAARGRGGLIRSRNSSLDHLPPKRNAYATAKKVGKMIVLLNLGKSALDDFEIFARAASLECDVSKIAIDVAPKPHTPGGLPTGRMAVYCFFWNGKALKIGIAGPNSDARYRSQHYNPNSARSTLANSLLTKPEKAGIPALRSNFAGDWIKRNTDRINFLLPAMFDREVLSHLELFLHSRWKPIYEGRE
jgi:hypothetical protein